MRSGTEGGAGRVHHGALWIASRGDARRVSRHGPNSGAGSGSACNMRASHACPHNDCQMGLRHRPTLDTMGRRGRI